MDINLKSLHSKVTSKEINWNIVCSGALSSFLLYKIYKQISALHKKKTLAKLIRSRAQEKPFLTYSATELANLIRTGELTAVEVVQECIKQSKLVEPFINSITDQCFDEAIKEAETVDKLISSLRNTYPERLQKLSEEKPFLGVPFYSKECFEVPGFNFTSGILKMKGNKGKNWNPIIWRVKQSGAILLGSGNMSEAGMWYESYNKIYGCSNNPYDPSRTVGGSSGGGCALVASLGAPFCITGDIGGSTRIPALFNGLFGHKASGGSTPNLRNFNKPTKMLQRYCQLGGTSRHIEDIITIQRIIGGPITAEEAIALKIEDDENPDAHLHQNFSWKREPSVQFDKTVKVLNLTTIPRGRTPTTKPERDQLLARESIKEAFKRNGNSVIDIQIDEFNRAFDLWAAMVVSASTIPLAEKLSQGLDHVVNIPFEFLKFILSFGYLSNFTFPLLACAMIDQLGKSNPKALEKEIEDFHAFKKKIYSLLNSPLYEEERDEKVIMLVNSLPFVAPNHGPIPHIFTLADVSATCIFNALELPATAVTTGLGSKNLPTGAQIVAGYGKDVLCLEAAEFLYAQGVCRYELPRLS